MIFDQISQFDRVLILGFAREGQSTYKFLRSKFPKLIIGLADQKTPDWIPDDPKTEKYFSPDYLSQSLITNHYHLIIKTPGISPHKPEIIAAKTKGAKFTSHTQIFFEICPSKKTIGITGTKGKSTTTSLIHHILTANGIPAVLAGNIGRPALDFLPEITPETWVIMELSSYQLMDLNTSPHIAVLLSIYPDHLDYHTDFIEYKTAKLNITKFQTPNDYLITQLKVPTRAQKIPLFRPSQPIPSQLLGSHNQLNIQPAVIIGNLLDIPEAKIFSAVNNFTPLDTRLQLVATKNGIRFFADTLATIPEATIAAIDALHPDVYTLIAGGHERKQNYSELAKKILSGNIKTLILFPATGTRIWEEVKKIGGRKINHFFASSMSDAVKMALDHTASGKICVLSPAAPSFTLFKDYRDESNQYRKFIQEIS